MVLFVFSLQEVLHVERKLYLVFEYLDQDLKKYMDANGTTGLSPVIAKVHMLNLINLYITSTPRACYTSCLVE